MKYEIPCLLLVGSTLVPYWHLTFLHVGFYFAVTWAVIHCRKQRNLSENQFAECKEYKPTLAYKCECRQKSLTLPNVGNICIHWILWDPKNGRFAAARKWIMQSHPPGRLPLLGNAKSEPPKFVHWPLVQQTSNPSYRVVAGSNWKTPSTHCLEALHWSPCFKPVLSENRGPKSLKCGITLSYFSAYPTFRPAHIEDMDSQGL